MAASVQESIGPPPLDSEWLYFVDLLERGLKQYRGRPFQSHRHAYAAFHAAICNDLRSETTQQAIVRSWGDLDPRATRLLRLELRAVTAALEDVVAPDPTIPPPERPGRGFRLPQPIRSWFGLKNSLRAGGALMDSLNDLLKALPEWAKALLTIGKEAIDVITGG